MKNSIFMMVIFTTMTSNIIFDFNQNSDLKNWVVTNDVVMGGKSSGAFRLNPEGHGVFEGFVSLDNNGGFSSVKYKFKRRLIENFTRIVLRVKGDGKKYQFRIKSSSKDYYSYIETFVTHTDWQDIEIPLQHMYPWFRGRKLNKANFSESYIEEIAFLIGNKREESFQLLVDKIELR